MQRHWNFSWPPSPGILAQSLQKLRIGHVRTQHAWGSMTFLRWKKKKKKTYSILFYLEKVWAVIGPLGVTLGWLALSLPDIILYFTSINLGIHFPLNDGSCPGPEAAKLSLHRTSPVGFFFLCCYEVSIWQHGAWDSCWRIQPWFASQ